MPIYEFHCSKCKKDFEELCMGDAKGVSCPKCGGKKVKKIMSACAHKSSGGKFVSSSGGGGSCGSCSGGSCSSCGH